MTENNYLWYYNNKFKSIEKTGYDFGKKNWKTSQEFCKTLSNSKDSSPLFDKTLTKYVRDSGSINSQRTEYKSQALQQAK